MKDNFVDLREKGPLDSDSSSAYPVHKFSSHLAFVGGMKDNTNAQRDTQNPSNNASQF